MCDETMKQVYLLAQEHCGLKVEDCVKVSRKAESGESGWNNFWIDDMDQAVGSIGKIVGLGMGGVGVYFSTPIINTWNFPYFILEKVEKPAHEFKPFDKVLVRDNSKENWRCNIFSHWIGGDYPYYCIKNPFKYCIPYEGNEHLVGTNDMPNE